EHDPRPLHVLEGQLLRARGPLQHAPLLLAELDLVTRRARHRRITSPRPPPTPSPRFRPILPDASTSALLLAKSRRPTSAGGRSCDVCSHGLAAVRGAP